MAPRFHYRFLFQFLYKHLDLRADSLSSHYFNDFPEFTRVIMSRSQFCVPAKSFQDHLMAFFAHQPMAIPKTYWGNVCTCASFKLPFLPCSSSPYPEV